MTFKSAFIWIVASMASFLMVIPTQNCFAVAVPNAKIIVNIPSRTLWLYSGDQVVAYYPVGVGMPNFPTPIGSFEVIHKVIDPDFENPYKPSGASKIYKGGSKSSPLGTRWIGFTEDGNGEYGIHGTNAPSSVGQYSSHGCIRMQVKDAEALFDKVDVGTPVDITYEQVLVENNDNELSVLTYPDVMSKGKPSLAEVKRRILNAYPSAKIDDALLAEAIANPTEKSVQVGEILPAEGETYVNVMGKIIEDDKPANDFGSKITKFLQQKK